MQGNLKNAPTGTPTYMALSILRGGSHSVSSELESLFYVLIKVVSTQHALRWESTPFGLRAAGMRWLFMTLSFEADVLASIPPKCHSVITNLHQLFFAKLAGEFYGYCCDVGCKEFQEALDPSGEHVSIS